MRGTKYLNSIQCASLSKIKYIMVMFSIYKLNYRGLFVGCDVLGCEFQMFGF